jgi:hypothetical protein
MVLGVIADSTLGVFSSNMSAGGWVIDGEKTNKRVTIQKSNDPNDHRTSAAHKGEYMNRQ